MPLDLLGSINPPFSSSPIDEIREAFRKIGLSSQDVLLELGCGEAGNLILAAEEFGAGGIGYEFLDSVYDRAKKNIEDHNLQDSILLRKQSLYEIQEEDLENSTFAYLYLSDTANQILESVLKQHSIKILTRVFTLPSEGKKLTEHIRLYDDFSTRCKRPEIAGDLIKIIP
ncbi:MAG: SAM-dependent methyltransferase [Archaeoglobaceae archaeon]